MAVSEPSILGIDLSLTCTGLAIAHSGAITWTGSVKTTGRRGDDLNARTARLRDIRNLVEASVLRSDPVLAVIEAPSFGSVGGSAHDRSGLWWLVVDMLYLRSVPVVQITPKQRAKYGTGNGNSDKREVFTKTKARYERLGFEIANDNEADAALLAAMGARHLGVAVEWHELSPDCLDALVKVDWP